MVKRKKYTEDLDIKITDDEDEQEDVDVTTTAAAVASISGGTAAQLKQEMEQDGDGLPSMQFFVVSANMFKQSPFLPEDLLKSGQNGLQQAVFGIRCGTSLFL